ncbi:unnamed protein product [Boreogadus saida]
MAKILWTSRRAAELREYIPFLCRSCRTAAESGSSGGGSSAGVQFRLWVQPHAHYTIKVDRCKGKEP